MSVVPDFFFLPAAERQSYVVVAAASARMQLPALRIVTDPALLFSFCVRPLLLLMRAHHHLRIIQPER